MNRHRYGLLAFAFVVMIGTSVSAFADDDSLLHILNDSDWSIYHLYISPVDAEDWGPDLLDEDLEPGHLIILTDIPCDKYDIMVVDEDGDECIIRDVLCNHEATWIITNDELLECEGFGGDEEE